MMDHTALNVLKQIETMCGMPAYYLSTAVTQDKLSQIVITFDNTKDNNGVTVKSQHKIEVSIFE